MTASPLTSSVALEMKVGPRAGARFELDPKIKTLIGRGMQCQIQLQDPQSSRIHATVYFDDDCWWIRDTESSNGTYVNGQRINHAQLSFGNEFRIGSTVFAFQKMLPLSAGGDHRSTIDQTVVFDQHLPHDDTGQYTLGFLKNVTQGEDFFFLFQLSVKLLGTETPDEVIRVSLERLVQRTEANLAGFLWLTESGQLKPKVIWPEDAAGNIQLQPKLTERVVQHRRAIRVEQETDVGKREFVDSICVPVLRAGAVVGAIHVYRRQHKFRDEHFRLVCSAANIMALGLVRANRAAMLEAENERLVKSAAETDEIMGDSKPVVNLKSKIQKISRATGCVLIRGESGAGKELVARALHRASPRSDRPLLSVNCAAIPRDLMESQLFGHKKGAFTSADSDHQGWFQQADSGTLFLDEVGELTLDGQAKLLRILEGHPFLPVGGTQQLTVDVRVICATNRDLREFVEEKKFREDLFYRLSVFELYVPPLRERGSDMQMLVEHFLELFKQKHGRPNLKLAPEARQRLLAYQWPGNVRQLRNVIDSAVIMADSDLILADDLGLTSASPDRLETLRIDHWERKLIVESMQRTEGNVPQAAKLLGISRATLYRKIDDYGLKR
jgi:two-component system, NtrC family, response regulator HydG